MLEALNRVRGAVAKKDLVPVLTHFHIYDGRIQGSNGSLSIDTNCPGVEQLNITVPAVQFLKAVDACDGEPSLKITPKGKLSVTRGKFRVLLPLAKHEDFPRSEKQGKSIAMNDLGILEPLKTLQAYIGEDASRPWCCGVLISGEDAYATNNMVLIRTKSNWGALETSINLPGYAVNELLRLKQEPIAIYQQDNCMTFEYSDGTWLKTQLFESTWPDVVGRIPDTIAGFTEIDELGAAVEKILPFCPDPNFPEIQIGPEGVLTADGDMSAEISGIELPKGKFRAEPLLSMLQIATSIEFEAYPRPCPFKGDKVEGVIVGVQ